MKLVKSITKRGRLILNNHSHYPDELMFTLIASAMKLVGIRGITYAQVFYPAKTMPSFAFHRKGIPYGINLTGKWKKAVTSGHIDLHPHYQGRKDILTWGEQFLDTIVHELNHVKDFEMDRKFGNYDRRWKNRPHEKRAVRNTDRLLKGENLSNRSKDHKRVANEALLNLCLYIEENKLHEKYKYN